MIAAEAPIVIGGIPIPSDAPAFLAVLALHVPAGLGATVAGAWAMLARKGSERHTRAGTIYYWLLATVAATMAALAAMRWAEDKALFVLGALSITSASVGRRAMPRRSRGFVALHVVGMGCSYILMLTAFYVDNGRNLPLWKLLPSLAYWLIPALVGVPLIVRAVLKYRRVKF
jgi:uncharacterized membrane protein